MIHHYTQNKDPKHYFDLGIKASYTRNIPEEIRNFKKAIYFCRKDLSKHASLATSSYNGLATAYMHKEAYNKAEETLIKGLNVSLKYFGKISRETYFLYSSLSLFASYDKNFSKAAKYACELLEIRKSMSPTDNKRLASRCRRISKLYLKAKNKIKAKEYKEKVNQYLEKAIADFSHAIKLNPNNNKLYFLRGTAYCEMKKYDKAIQDNSKAIKLTKLDKAQTYSIGIAYYLTIIEVCIIAGKSDKFKYWLKQFERNTPKNKLSKDDLIIKLYLTLVSKCVMNATTTDIEKRLNALLKNKGNIRLNWSFDLTDKWLKNSKNGLTPKQIKYIQDLTNKIKAVSYFWPEVIHVK